MLTNTSTVWGDTIRVWAAQSFREIHRFRHENFPQSCAFSPDGILLAVTGGGWNRSFEVKIWNAETGSLVTELEGHEQDVGDCAYSPDGTRKQGRWNRKSTFMVL